MNKLVETQKREIISLKSSPDDEKKKLKEYSNKSLETDELNVQFNDLKKQHNILKVMTESLSNKKVELGKKLNHAENELNAKNSEELGIKFKDKIQALNQEFKNSHKREQEALRKNIQELEEELRRDNQHLLSKNLIFIMKGPI